MDSYSCLSRDAHLVAMSMLNSSHVLLHYFRTESHLALALEKVQISLQIQTCILFAINKPVLQFDILLKSMMMNF